MKKIEKIDNSLYYLLNGVMIITVMTQLWILAIPVNIIGFMNWNKFRRIKHYNKAVDAYYSKDYKLALKEIEKSLEYGAEEMSEEFREKLTELVGVSR